MSTANVFKPPSEKLPPPPNGLKSAGKAFWLAVHRDFEVEGHLLAVLEHAARQLDRANAARRRQQSATSDSARERAECSERSASLAFIKLRRELNLDREPVGPKSPGLPGKRY